MPLIIKFVVALLGSLLNHIRGGFLAVLRIKYVAARDKITYNEASMKVSSLFNSIGKQMNHLLFGLIFACLLPADSWGILLLNIIVLYIGMFGGASMGWGTYIGGMIERTISQESEIAFIDMLVLKGKSSYPVLRNCIALSLRGVLWTLCISTSFIFLSLWTRVNFIPYYIIPVGLLMGPTYLLAMELCQRLPKSSRSSGWQLGEYFWGFILWGSIVLFLL